MMTKNIRSRIEKLELTSSKSEKRRLASLKQYADTEVELFPQREQGKARDLAGDMFGVSGRYVDEFGKIGIEN